MNRRGFVRVLGGTLAAPAIPFPVRADENRPDPIRAAEEIRAEFRHGWDGYRRVAWGHDELLPVSGGTNDFFVPGHSFGLSIIEALDTLYVMALDDDLSASADWLEHHLSFDVDGDVQVFESIIRMVGGLLAGHAATGRSFMLDAARDLADRLLPAFTKSPTGAPYRFVNLRTGAVREPHSNLAEIGTNLLEFGTLSQLLHEPKYLNASMRAYRAVMERRSQRDLLGTHLNVETGEWIDSISVAPNPPVDSFYEYLWGGWRLFHNEQTRDWYRLLLKAMLDVQVDRTSTGLWFRQVNFRDGLPSGTRQSELAAFFAEILVKGGDRAVGEAYYDAWTSVAKRYDLIPEEIDYNDLTIVDAGYELRPEYANAAFDLWYLTGDPKYRTTAYAHFQQLRAHCRVPGGYTIVTDVRPRPMILGDLTPGYWFAENMKYLYLTFADTPRFDPTVGYLSTEGKILRGLRRQG